MPIRVYLVMIMRVNKPPQGIQSPSQGRHYHAWAYGGRSSSRGRNSSRGSSREYAVSIAFIILCLV